MFTDTSGECLYCTVADNSLTFWNLENKAHKVNTVIYGFKVSTLNEKQGRGARKSTVCNNTTNVKAFKEQAVKRNTCPHIHFRDIYT